MHARMYFSLGVVGLHTLCFLLPLGAFPRLLRCHLWVSSPACGCRARIDGLVSLDLCSPGVLFLLCNGLPFLMLLFIYYLWLNM